MRDLKFKNPVEIKETTITVGEALQFPDEKHYNRLCAVFTKHGIVTVCDFDWQTNIGTDTWTTFATVIDGEIWRADLNEGRLSDLRIKWMATHFIKKCIAAYSGESDLK